MQKRALRCFDKQTSTEFRDLEHVTDFFDKDRSGKQAVTAGILSNK